MNIYDQQMAAEDNTKGLPELEQYANLLLPNDYEITEVLGDIIMAEFVDSNEDGSLINRGGIFVNNNITQNTWRVARVLLHGKGCSSVIKKNALIMFPNDKGIKAVKFGSKKQPVVFLNEERIFGIVKPLNENKPGKSKNTPAE